MDYRYVAVILAIIVVVALGALLLMHKAGGGNGNGGVGTGVTTTTTTNGVAATTATTTSTTTTNGTATSTSAVKPTSNLAITFKKINDTWYEFIIPYPKVNYLSTPINKTYVLHNVSWYDVVTGKPIYNPVFAQIVAPTPQWINVYNASGAFVGQLWFSGNNPGVSTFTNQNYKFVGNDLILYVKTIPVKPGMVPGIVETMLVPGKTYTFLLIASNGKYAGLFNATYVQ